MMITLMPPLSEIGDELMDEPFFGADFQGVGLSAAVLNGRATVRGAANRRGVNHSPENGRSTIPGREIRF